MKITKPIIFIAIPLTALILQGCGSTVINPPGPGKVIVKPGKKAIVVRPGHRHGARWRKRCHRHGGLGRHCH